MMKRAASIHGISEGISGMRMGGMRTWGMKMEGHPRGTDIQAGGFDIADYSGNWTRRDAGAEDTAPSNAQVD